MAGRALFDDDVHARLVRIRDGLDVRLRANEQAEAGLQIGLREIDRLRALGVRRHGGNDEVDLAGLERGDEAAERNVFDHDLASERFAERVRKIDAHASRLALRVGHLERRIGQLHADDQLRAVLPGAPAEEQREGDEIEECFQNAPTLTPRMKLPSPLRRRGQALVETGLEKAVSSPALAPGPAMTFKKNRWLRVGRL